MIEDLLDDIRQRFGDRVGGVLYAGLHAFSRPSDVYLLGLNPADNRFDPERATVAAQIDAFLAREEPWSAYVDDVWTSPVPGGSPMQVRVRHLLEQGRLDPRSVPASNVVFVRSRDASGIAQEKQDLLEQYWLFHSVVIDRLSMRVIVCMGGHVGRWVRQRLRAGRLVGEHVENNRRRWKSALHASDDGHHVLSLTHPSRVNWCAPESDPSSLLVHALELSRRNGASACR